MTDEQSDWGPWLEHDGNGCPDELVGRYLHLWFEGAELPPRELYCVLTPLYASCGSWYRSSLGAIGTWEGKSRPMQVVTHYRIRKPLGLRLLEEAVREIGPAKVRQEEPA